MAWPRQILEGGGVRRRRPAPWHRAAARARGLTGGPPRFRPGAGDAGGTGGISARGTCGGPDRRCPHRAGYRWPAEGWVRGTVARRTRAAGFTHVVRYGRTSALGSEETPSLLDGASHGPAGRWVLLQRV